MPDSKGALSAEEHHRCNEKFEGYEQKLGRDLKCEVCEGIVWRLNDHVLTVPGDSSAGLFGSRITAPLVNYYCINCGNMKFFSAHMWGMTVSRESSPDKAGEKQNGDG